MISNRIKRNHIAIASSLGVNLLVSTIMTIFFVQRYRNSDVLAGGFWEFGVFIWVEVGLAIFGGMCIGIFAYRKDVPLIILITFLVDALILIPTTSFLGNISGYDWGLLFGVIGGGILAGTGVITLVIRYIVEHNRKKAKDD